MQETKNLNHSVLPQKIKISELTIKNVMSHSTGESLRPIPSLKRKKSLKPRALIRLCKKQSA